MVQDEFGFRRRFELWSYVVSHGQLLVRSNKSNEWSTRIDILFKDVVVMEIPTLFDEILVRRSSQEEARSLQDRLGGVPTERRKLFIVQGLNFSGYVVAGAVFWHEDQGEFYDNSYFEKSWVSRGSTRN